MWDLRAVRESSPELVPHRAKASRCRLHVLHRLWILRQPLSHDERAARGIRAGGDTAAHEERSRLDSITGSCGVGEGQVDGDRVAPCPCNNTPIFFCP